MLIRSSSFSLLLLLFSLFFLGALAGEKGVGLRKFALKCEMNGKMVERHCIVSF